jgi:hypothetical protein
MDAQEISFYKTLRFFHHINGLQKGVPVSVSDPYTFDTDADPDSAF